MCHGTYRYQDIWYIWTVCVLWYVQTPRYMVFMDCTFIQIPVYSVFDCGAVYL